MAGDPVATNPTLYRVILENDRVRGLIASDQEANVDMEAGVARWLAAQEHSGEKIGESETHVIFIELKEPRPEGTVTQEPTLGPSNS